MLIAEAPGGQEDQPGLPFVGSFGGDIRVSVKLFDGEKTAEFRAFADVADALFDGLPDLQVVRKRDAVWSEDGIRFFF